MVLTGISARRLVKAALVIRACYNPHIGFHIYHIKIRIPAERSNTDSQGSAAQVKVWSYVEQPLVHSDTMNSYGHCLMWNSRNFVAQVIGKSVNMSDF